MNPRHSRRRPRPAAIAAILIAAGPALAIAQQRARVTPETFSAPDGTRFVLIPTSGAPQVHWVIATMADATDDPPGLVGLSAAVTKASLGGTWKHGSSDPERERAALEALDGAYAAMQERPTDADVAARVRASQQLVGELGDTTVFARVLAATPASAPSVTVRGSVALFELTTIPAAVGDVAALLLERREQQVLRSLPEHWLAEIVARQNAYDSNPLSTVHGELLALALPNHPASRAAGRPGRVMARRAQGIATWQATQHPSRSVHVLLGGFDSRSVRAVLESTFAATTLPAPANRASQPLRPPASLRRSTVPGTGRSLVALAWALPPIDAPTVLRVGTLWLETALTEHLQRQGRKTAMVKANAPWPIAIDGHGLLLLEVEDPAGTDGLAELIGQACRELTAKPPPRWRVQNELRALQSDWSLVTAEPRWLAAEIARYALLWPKQPPRLSLPSSLKPEAVQGLLAKTFAGQPVIVEAMR